MDSAGFEPAAFMLRTEGVSPLSKPLATFGRPLTVEESIEKRMDSAGFEPAAFTLRT
jgi:hypothetical protein